MTYTIGFIGEVVKITLISLLIILPIRFFVAQPFFVRGASMEPAFHDGDYLIIDELSYRFGDPSRGDVVVFRGPADSSQFLIKRVIGLPGETVSIRDGDVFINDKKLSEPYLAEQTPGDASATLQEDEFFVLGDNRDASYDSRQWGSLTGDDVVGKALIRAWPIPRFDFISIPTYGF